MLGKLKTLDLLSPLPFFKDVSLSRDFLCYRNGKLIDHKTLGLHCSIEVLTLVAFHHFNLPPIYWKSLKALFPKGVDKMPENGLLAPQEPLRSLEQPGFYVIPYFSNYVINQDGVLFKKSTAVEITASKAATNYYTFRMADDSNKTSNVLRHRVLAYAFIQYGIDVNLLDINHINGIPGDDVLSNLEWATRSRNVEHAYSLGLRNDNVPVQVREVLLNCVYIFRSMSEAAEFVGVTQTTIANRLLKGPEFVYSGFQFRLHPADEPWPEEKQVYFGKYLVKCGDDKIRCTALVASRLMGVTRTSFLRAVREKRWVSLNGNELIKIYESPTGE